MYAGTASSPQIRSAPTATLTPCCVMLQESAGLRSRLEAAQRHSRTLEAERNGAQERLAAAQAREQALKEVGPYVHLPVRCCLSVCGCADAHCAWSDPQFEDRALTLCLPEGVMVCSCMHGPVPHVCCPQC